MKKKILCLAMAAFLLSACGSSKSTDVAYAETESFAGGMNSSSQMNEEIVLEDSYDYKEMTDTSAPAEGAFDGGAGSTSGEKAQVQDTNRKLIKTVNLSVETQEFDNLLQIVENKTAECGGYIEQLYTYNGSIYSSYKRDKSASLTLRIPKDKLEDFLSEVGQVSNIIDRNETVEDVTLTYVDMESRKKVLRAEEERLLSFMEQAQTIEEMITIESRLSDVRYQIESMESQLRTYDNKIDYSTVYMDINEVAVLTPPVVEEETIWQRIGNGFMNSVESILDGLKEVFVTLIIISPYLIFIALIIFSIAGIVVGSVKLADRKQKKKVVKAGSNVEQKKE